MVKEAGEVRSLAVAIGAMILSWGWAFLGLAKAAR